ncbi:hypothetical protein PVK06_007592 [Gossypium arboreum]|uniref:Uncharacterized protein n=1 Tax=Gossypium arboreum TaxID=29729 RepID=A0ABR0QIP5_GOSAR|nr:hypothetical protein PVK06_007592 [Gossypium arboreum]
MAMNFYMWLAEQSYYTKQSKVNDIGSEDKHQQVLDRLNKLEMSSAKVQVQK